MKIVFKENATAWTGDIDYDLMFLETQAEYIKAIYKHRGYMYLNQIYEYFGVGWSPNLRNPCYRITDSMSFRFEPVRDIAIVIHIE